METKLYEDMTNLEKIETVENILKNALKEASNVDVPFGYEYTSGDYANVNVDINRVEPEKSKVLLDVFVNTSAESLIGKERFTIEISLPENAYDVYDVLNGLKNSLETLSTSFANGSGEFKNILTEKERKACSEFMMDTSDAMWNMKMNLIRDEKNNDLER